MRVKKRILINSGQGWRGNPYGIRGAGSQSFTLATCNSRFVTVIRQEYGQHPQKWQESADFVNQEDAGVIRDHPQHRCTKPAHTEGETEKESGNHTDTAR